MGGHAIRALTGKERALRDELDALRYEALFAEIEAEEQAEHEQEFGPAIPFKPDGRRVHEKVVERIRAAQVGL